MGNLAAEYRMSLYSILTKLNQSNKSEVSLVLNTQDNKIYTKKVLKNYNLEVYKVLKEVRHLNMPIIYELYENDGELTVIEEFINGNTLEEILEKNGPLSENKVIKYMINLCNILNVMHKLNPAIIHRDIKPSNIIINNDDNLKLIDYDVSRYYKENENRDTVILGTEGFASPEQFGFEQTDARSDIYSMGVLMNVLTTGKHPKEVKNEGKLKYIIEKCIKISPNDRYGSVWEVRERLLRLKSEECNLYRKNKREIKRNNEKNKINLDLDLDVTKNLFKFIKGILKVLWYGFLATGIVPIIWAETTRDRIQFIALVLSLLIITLLYSGFMGLNRKLPLLNSKDEGARVGGYILYTLFIMFIACIFFV